MEYQKISHLLDRTTDQSSKFRTKAWVEMNDEARETCETDTQIKFKTTVLKLSRSVVHTYWYRKLK